jgi:FtsZ-binding cell division protein ZapB
MSELNELNRKIRQMMDEITHYELDIKRLLATKAQLEEEIK